MGNGADATVPGARSGGSTAGEMTEWSGVECRRSLEPGVVLVLQVV
jgi:hypothetical protein